MMIHIQSPKDLYLYMYNVNVDLTHKTDEDILIYSDL